MKRSSTALRLLFAFSLPACVVGLSSDGTGESESGLETGLIQHVEIPTTACVNEPVLVNVVTAGLDPNVRVSVQQRRTGNPSVLQFDEVGEHEVFVRVVSGIDGVQQDFVPIQIIDCTETYAGIEAHPLFRKHSYAFTAAPLINLPAQPTQIPQDIPGDPGPDGDEVELPDPQIAQVGDIVQYVWDFGGGQTAVTDKPYVEHDFSPRLGTAPEIATYLIRVTATTVQGDEITGMMSLSFDNVYRQNANAGEITPVIDVSPTEHRGAVHQVLVAIRHYEPKRIRLIDAEVVYIPCNSEDQEARRAAQPKHIIAGPRELQPDQATQLVLWLDDSRIAPGTCYVRFELTGKTGNTEVQIPVTMEAREREATQTLDPNEPEPENQARFNRVERAFQILGRTGPGATVTDEEIRRLHRQGLLDPP